MAMIGLGLGRQNFHLLKRKTCLLLKLIACFYFCESVIYYLAIFWYNWPEVKTTAYDGEQATCEPVLKAIFLSDTHLLGKFPAFQIALWLLQPEVVFILGDVFDEGKRSTPEAWADDAEQFQKIFRHPRHVQLKVVAGNHNTGFHCAMNTYKVERSEKAFISERLLSWKGIKFMMVNSMALKGDGCVICSEAEAELIEVSHKLNYSRESDTNCSGEDAAPLEERNIPFKENYDVLSQETSQKLMWWLQPHLVLSGRTHSLSLLSFSWRNRNKPSFIMGSTALTDYTLSKCYLPHEDVVLIIYCEPVGFLVVLTLTHFGLITSPFLSDLNLLRKHKTR
uniref:Metallophosphoesterase 1 n=1 Tax=Aotus nancymaae TaxID=37293 RepID=A0A2K5CP62_AOTNA